MREALRQGSLDEELHEVARLATLAGLAGCDQTR